MGSLQVSGRMEFPRLIDVGVGSCPGHLSYRKIKLDDVPIFCFSDFVNSLGVWAVALLVFCTINCYSNQQLKLSGYI